MDYLSPAQCVGYVAFCLGVTAFLQKDDRRLKIFNGSECLAYVVHLFLLGNDAGSAAMLVAATRSFLALKTSSRIVAAIMIGCNVGLAFFTVDSWLGVLPVLGACAGTIGIFLLRGIPLRLVMLCSSALWLANNILCGSIGGVALETMISLANLSTIARLVVSERRVGAQPASPPNEKLSEGSAYPSAASATTPTVTAAIPAACPGEMRSL